MVDFACQILFESKHRDFFVGQFKQEFCRLYGMIVELLLNLYLQAGLSPLKTPDPTIVISDLISVCLSANPDCRICRNNE